LPVGEKVCHEICLRASKHYHFDWTLPPNASAAFQNLVAAHLLKWVLRGVNYFCRSTTTISAGEGLAKERRWRPQRNSVIVAGRSRAICERCLSSS
jgi:hypothetical protein